VAALHTRSGRLVLQHSSSSFDRTLDVVTSANSLTHSVARDVRVRQQPRELLADLGGVMSRRGGSRLIVAGTLGAILFALYPTVIHPMLAQDEYGASFSNCPWFFCDHERACMWDCKPLSHPMTLLRKHVAPVTVASAHDAPPRSTYIRCRDFKLHAARCVRHATRLQWLSVLPHQS
jgi:hypothetical protein